MRRSFFLAWAVVALGVLPTGEAGSQPLLPTNDDPARQIRFDWPAEADNLRAALVVYVWPGGLPATLPSVTEDIPFPADLDGIDPALTASVDRLDADVSGAGFHALSYLLHPSSASENADRLVILHQGHGGNASPLGSGIDTTASHLLEEGFSVILMQMPLLGWNTDATANMLGQALTFTSHDDIIGQLGGGVAFRLFLEPVVQSVNHYLATQPGSDINAVGISGGAWTVHMAAALDERIHLTLPVAGSAPFYVRNADPASRGDAEQFFVPLYDEDIAEDGTGGGVATWLEIYALGAYGADRRQIMVTNEFDNCCFSGTFADSFRDIVSTKVEDDLGLGRWEHVLDSTHTQHKLSSYFVAEILDPALNPPRVPALGPAGRLLVALGVLGGGIRAHRRRPSPDAAPAV